MIRPLRRAHPWMIAALATILAVAAWLLHRAPEPDPLLDVLPDAARAAHPRP